MGLPLKEGQLQEKALRFLVTETVHLLPLPHSHPPLLLSYSFHGEGGFYITIIITLESEASSTVGSGDERPRGGAEERGDGDCEERNLKMTPYKKEKR